MRKVQHEITLIFFTTHEDGLLSICDIVETSRHNAYKFMSRNMRAVYKGMEPATHVAAIAPGAPWESGERRAL